MVALHAIYNVPAANGNGLQSARRLTSKPSDRAWRTSWPVVMRTEGRDGQAGKPVGGVPRSDGLQKGKSAGGLVFCHPNA